MKRRILWLVLLGATFFAAWVGLIWQRYMRAIHARLPAEARVFETAFGPVDYAFGGKGSPVRENESAAIDPAVPISPAALAALVLLVHARDDRLTPLLSASSPPIVSPAPRRCFPTPAAACCWVSMSRSGNASPNSSPMPRLPRSSGAAQPVGFA